MKKEKKKRISPGLQWRFVRGGAGLGCLCSEILRGLEPLGQHRPCGPGGGEALSGFSLSLPRSRCCFLHFCTATEVVVVGFWVGLVSFFHQKKKKRRGGTDKRAPLTKKQVSVRTEGEESSAKCRPTA